MKYIDLKFLRNCQLGAIHYDLKNALLYFNLSNDECSAISLPCLNGTGETDFILEEYGKEKNWSEIGNSWYGNTMDFVVCDEMILALVSPATKRICLTETPIVSKKGGFLSSFCIETSEQYLEKEYGISTDEFLSIIQQKYLDLKENTSEKVKKFGKMQ